MEGCLHFLVACGQKDVVEPLASRGDIVPSFEVMEVKCLCGTLHG